MIQLIDQLPSLFCCLLARILGSPADVVAVATGIVVGI